jgi:hypothetical protein
VIAVVLAASVASLLVGLLAGAGLTRRRAYLVCQRQALLDNAPRPLVAFGYNPVPHQRRRWLRDRKPRTERQPEPLVRPVFHD